MANVILAILPMLVFCVQGYAISLLFFKKMETMDRMIISFPLSFAFNAIVFSYLGLFGLKLTRMSLVVIFLPMALIVAKNRDTAKKMLVPIRMPIRRKSKKVKKFGIAKETVIAAAALILILVFSYLLYLLPLPKDCLIPVGTDSSYQVYYAYLIDDQGKFPPYLTGINSTALYPLGSHMNLVLFHWITGAPFYVLFLFFLPFVASLVPLQLYFLGKTLFDKKTGMLAAIFSAFVTVTLQWYVNAGHIGNIFCFLVTPLFIYSMIKRTPSSSPLALLPAMLLSSFLYFHGYGFYIMFSVFALFSLSKLILQRTKKAFRTVCFTLLVFLAFSMPMLINLIGNGDFANSASSLEFGLMEGYKINTHLKILLKSLDFLAVDINTILVGFSVIGLIYMAFNKNVKLDVKMLLISWFAVVLFFFTNSGYSPITFPFIELFDFRRMALETFLVVSLFSSIFLSSYFTYPRKSIELRGILVVLAMLIIFNLIRFASGNMKGLDLKDYVFNAYDLKAQIWMKDNIPQTSNVMTEFIDGVSGMWIPTVAEKDVYWFRYPPLEKTSFSWPSPSNTKYALTLRVATINQTNKEETIGLLRQNGVTHIYVSGHKSSWSFGKGCESFNIATLNTIEEFRLIYSNEVVYLFEVI
jgi:hypothetical protein